MKSFLILLLSWILLINIILKPKYCLSRIRKRKNKKQKTKSKSDSSFTSSPIKITIIAPNEEQEENNQNGIKFPFINLNLQDLNIENNEFNLQLDPNEPPIQFHHVELRNSIRKSVIATEPPIEENVIMKPIIEIPGGPSDKEDDKQEQQSFLEFQYWYGEGRNKSNVTQISSTINLIFQKDWLNESKVITFGSIIDEEQNTIYRIGRDHQNQVMITKIPIDYFPDESDARFPPLISPPPPSSSAAAAAAADQKKDLELGRSTFSESLNLTLTNETLSEEEQINNSSYITNITITNSSYSATIEPSSLNYTLSIPEDEHNSTDTSTRSTNETSAAEQQSQHSKTTLNHLLSPQLNQNPTQKINIIDILVVWTQASECANSNLSTNCTVTSTTHSNMLGLVKQSIVETNIAFELSAINIELSLTYAYRHATYVETNSEQALDDVTYTLSDVHTHRHLYNADLVAFIIHDMNSCGLAWIGPLKEYMYSITAWNCAAGYFSLAHEISHNFGCLHDRGTLGACGSFEKYQHGYRDPNASFRTIMAYDCVTNECDGNAGQSCPRIQRFSNSEQLYQSKSMGDPWNDCSKRLNDVAEEVSMFY